MEKLVKDADTTLGIHIIAEEKPAQPAQPRKRKKSNKYERRRKKSRKAAEEQKRKETSPSNASITSVVSEEEKTNDKTKNPQKVELSFVSERENTVPKPKVNSAEHAAYLAEFHARPLELDRRAGATKVIRKSRASSHLHDGENASWEAMEIPDRLRNSLVEKLKLSSPTRIQSASIEAFRGTDNVLLQSETGSGKTLAYLLPILQQLAEPGKRERSTLGTRCLIVCPTRELAAQTLTVCETICRNTFHWLVPGSLLGEDRRKSEKAKLRKGLAIVIGTPGRLLDHLQRTESLLMALKGKLEWLVLDEADRLLDLGLGVQVEQIIQYLKSNQAGSGVNWRSALVSATVTQKVKELAKDSLGDRWTSVRGIQKEASTELADSTPRQLVHFHLTVSAKLRLTTLIALLAVRASKGEKVVVFLSTCASVDYHHALFQAVTNIMRENGDSAENAEASIFGSKCPVYRLHGSIPRSERQLALRQFSQANSAVLLCTDVAARGLNLPQCDWAVQYDPPAEVADYVHRAGRVARAGQAGHAVLFLLPSERDFLDILQERGVHMSPISLASTLNAAAVACNTGEAPQRSSKASSRMGESFSTDLQKRLEEIVVQENADAQEAAKRTKKKTKRTQAKPAKVQGKLMEMAKQAFLSFVRAYPTKEKLVRHIFAPRSLHLGHVARSFALKETPKKLGTDAPQGKVFAPTTKSRQLAFDPDAASTPENREIDQKKARELLMANAIKLHTGLDSL